MSEPEDKDLIKKEVELWCKELETGKIKFADSFIDSFTDLLMKDEAQVAQEELDYKLKLINKLDSLSNVKNEPIVVYSNGYLYGESIKDLGEIESQDPEKYGFIKLPDGNITWGCSWSDIFLSTDGSNSKGIWICVVQNKLSQESHFEFDMSVNNELLADAFKSKDKEMIANLQEDNKRLEELSKSDTDFRCVTLKTTNYLTKEDIKTAITVWISQFYPNLIGRDIIVK